MILAEGNGYYDARQQTPRNVPTGAGTGRAQDSVDELRKAAEQGSVDAHSNSGTCTTTAEGVPQDYAEAVKWYRLAAEQGHADAQFNPLRDVQ